MRILMIAPEPFFEPRGTPFSEFHRIRALTALGHQVDLVTYPFGQDVEMPGLRVVRALRPPFISRVKIGPSFAKVPLDLLLTLTACRMAMTRRYDVVHSHEEGGIIGVVLACLCRVPHLYDMHSSLPQQLTNFAFTGSALLRGLFRWLERAMIAGSRVVIVICPALEETVRQTAPSAQIVLIENAPGSSDAPATNDAVAAVRRHHGIAADAPLVLYTGTFEAYQGLDLLWDAMALVVRQRPAARVLIAGGKSDQVTRARAAATQAGLGDAVVFAGERPAAEIPAYLAACDVLVSPRSRGTNTPLKIYQYLRSGRPIVATRLLTHTQVLDDATAVLTEPTAAAFAAGVVHVIDDRADGARRAAAAVAVAETKYSYEAYLEKTKRACALLGVPSAPDGIAVAEGV